MFTTVSPGILGTCGTPFQIPYLTPPLPPDIAILISLCVDTVASALCYLPFTCCSGTVGLVQWQTCVSLEHRDAGNAGKLMHERLPLTKK